MMDALAIKRIALSSLSLRTRPHQADYNEGEMPAPWPAISVRRNGDVRRLLLGKRWQRCDGEDN